MYIHAPKCSEVTEIKIKTTRILSTVALDVSHLLMHKYMCNYSQDFTSQIIMCKTVLVGFNSYTVSK